MPRVIVTADLHFNNGRSHPHAIELVERINATGGDILILAGDTAIADGEALEECLSLFRWPGAKLFVPGNHELWTAGDDSFRLYHEALPRRVSSLGWRYLDFDPFVTDDFAIVGSIGWYDYSMAATYLQIPRRFYEAKLSPGAAERLPKFSALLDEPSDLPEVSRELVARWNDGRFIKLHRSDERFLDEVIDRLRGQLAVLKAERADRTIVAITHVLPFAELLPPMRIAQWDFAKAFLGARRLGQLLMEFPQIRLALCGHSHFPARALVGRITAINIGSNNRQKRFEVFDL